MDDIIRRSDILKILEAKANMAAGTNAQIVYDNVANMIEKMPTVDAEPVRNGRVKCYFCGRGKPIKAYTYLHDCGLQYGTTIEAVYCPNCGAMMDLEE